MYSEGESNSNSTEFGNRREGLLIINAVLLSKSTSYKTGLQSLNRAIGIMLDSEDPSTTHTRVAWNSLSASVSAVGQLTCLLSHCELRCLRAANAVWLPSLRSMVSPERRHYFDWEGLPTVSQAPVTITCLGAGSEGDRAGSSVCLPLRSLVVEALFKPYLPYMKGIVVEYLRRRTKLTDFRTVPEDAHELEEEIELLERTMYHRQMTSWLEYFRWYVKVQTDPEVNLGEFFTGPVVCKDWRSQKDTDPLFHQYGLLWKAYDWVLQNYTFQPNILGVGEATVREGEGLQ